MTTIRTLLALLTVFLTPIAAHANLFEFSYQFDDGTDITGSLEGNAAGDFVNNVTNISLSIDGNATGPLSLFSYWVYLGTMGEASAVSFDGSLNNFWFVSPDAVDGGGNLISDGSYGFALLGDSVTSNLANQLGNDLGFVVDLPNGIGVRQSRNNGSWQLRAVPEPGTLALLGLGLFGCGLVRRTKPA